MTEEQLEVQETTLEEALNQIEELKKSMVPKSELEKVKEDNRTLLKKIMDGPTKVEQPEEKPKWKDLFTKSRQMNGNNTTNLDFITHQLEIKKHYPKRIKFASNPKDEQRMIEFWTELVKDANGDEETFNMLLKKRVAYDAALDNENGKLTDRQMS